MTELPDTFVIGREGLAPYACQWRQSRGRLVKEAESPTRSGFQRDRDRIIHSTAFRRLKHKTQVFVYHEGDHFRTRLTHSIEVAQIARALARAFRVDEDLAEALALSHDFGHTPFGHTGEDTLNRLMKNYGGFDHNAQSFRIVTELEHRYADFDGLNLCWETLEGLVKHNGPIITNETIAGDIPEAIVVYNEKSDLELCLHSSIEAQCAAIADDIAYNAHDLDDGLRAGLFDLPDIAELPIVEDSLEQIHAKYPGLEETRIIHEIVRRQITRMVEDVIEETGRRIERTNPANDGDVRRAGIQTVAFSSQMEAWEASIKRFLHANMYRAPSVMRIRGNADAIVEDLFQTYFNDGKSMPSDWAINLKLADSKGGESQRARLVCDFIAGMTDRYAYQEHQRLFDVTPELV